MTAWTAVDNSHVMIFTSLTLIYELTGQLFSDKVSDTRMQRVGISD